MPRRGHWGRGREYRRQSPAGRSARRTRSRAAAGGRGGGGGGGGLGAKPVALSAGGAGGALAAGALTPGFLALGFAAGGIFAAAGGTCFFSRTTGFGFAFGLVALGEIWTGGPIWVGA